MTAMTAATRNNRPKVPVDIFALLTLHASITPNAGDEDRFIGAELDEESGDLIFLTITYGPGEGPGEN